MTISRIYCATGTVGGTSGCLDTIKYGYLHDKDMAIVMDQTNVLFFNYDDDNATAESTPWTTNRVIVPNDNDSGAGAWVLQSLYIEDLSLVVDDITVGDDVTIGGDTELKGAVQIGDADGTGSNLTIYSNTVGDYIVFDKAAKTFTLTDIQLVANSVDINGGAIDGTPIGAATPSTIVGSTVDATTDFTIGDTVITDGQIADATGLTLSGPVTFDTVAIGVLPTASNHLATKEYVDQAIDFVVDYYFSDVADAIGGIYYVAYSAPTGEAEGTITTAGLTEADDQPLCDFITEAGLPGTNVVPAGIYNLHIHAERTAGTRPTTIYFALYYRSADTSETLIGTSEESSAITSKGDVDLHMSVVDDVDIVATDRLVWKLFANCGVGADTTVALYTEGTTASRASTPTTTEVLNSIYLRQDGTTKLTGAWDLDSKALTNVNIDSGSIDNATIGAATAAAIIGTTIDATTDFTIGGTVITDNTISDGDILHLLTGTATQIDSGWAAGSDAALLIGQADVHRGYIDMYADDNQQAPYIQFYVPPDNDGDGTTTFKIQIVDNTDDLQIGADNDWDMLKFLGGATPSIAITCNWTAAGTTVADLGTVTTADIDGGTIDGITMGGMTRGDAALDTIDAAPASDENATGIVISATVDTNTYGYGGVVYLNVADGHWDDADKDAEATAGKMIGMVLGDGTGTKNIMLHGVVRQDAWDWTAGSPIFVGDAGEPIADVSSFTTGDIIRLIGYALTADTMFFNPAMDYFEVA